MQQHIEIDLQEVRELITDINFTTFLLEHTQSFEIAAFILQTLLDATKVPSSQAGNLDPMVDNE